MSGRREANKRDKHKRIIEAAHRLFREKGFDKTTTNEIAAAAGVGTGTVFTYAPTKDDLLIQVFHKEVAFSIDSALPEAMEQASLIDRTIAFLDFFLAYFEQDIPLARALMRQLGYVQSEAQRDLVLDLFRRASLCLVEILEDGQKTGEVSADVSLETAAATMFAIFHLNIGPYLSGMINRKEFDASLREGLKAFKRGL